MSERHFNLVTDPWIKVIDMTNEPQIVSLNQLFENAQNYRQLAGEMQAQDLAILRLLLAILTTVYTRVDADDERYFWLKANEQSPQLVEIDDEHFTKKASQKDLLATWKHLYQAGHFTAAIADYLKAFKAKFDFFGDQPFYQVTTADYDALVPAKKKIETGTGQVAVKQINRTISESGNTPAIFSPNADETKNKLSLDELIRWIITYQNFTGVTDKTKIEATDKFSNSAGWIYRINPVFAQGRSLFETLMLNLILVNDRGEYALQKPVWEYSSVAAYIKQRKTQLLPDNISALYTTWSRVLHIEWDDADQPTIFSAGIPIFEYDNALVEPMTTWRRDKKTNAYRPAVKGLRSLGIAMWRNFGQYVKVRKADDVHEPGIVVWLRRLREQGYLSATLPLMLNSVNLISDGNATSQAPAVEISDDLQLQADVLFDDPKKLTWWPLRIEGMIELTQTIATDYYHFGLDIAQIRDVDARSFAAKMSAKFYDRVNEPFKIWLSQLTNDGDDDREKKVRAWKKQLQEIIEDIVTTDMQASSPRDFKGITNEHGVSNIFTAKNRLMYSVRTHLK